MRIEELHKIFLKCSAVSTDTRKIGQNDIFFALKGDNFNGNEYAKKAFEQGASYAVLDEKDFAKEDNAILVDDVLTTLQDLANFHRNYCKAKVLALTGSNGKTTTKELINTVLSKQYKTVATKGNLNNHIGVPLTLLSIKTDTEIAVIEMGANHQKEIEFLSKIAEPDFGYITNFGKAHLEGFGGVEGVIKGKSELYDYLIPNNKGVFMNADDPIQKEKLSNYANKYGYSTTDAKFYVIRMVKDNPHVELLVEDVYIRTQLVGSYNFTNCCAAILIGKYFNINLETIKEGIETYIPENNRSQVIEKNGHSIILDAYNANPTSMKAALESFAKISSKNKVLFLGDMFELGDVASEEHKSIEELACSLGFNDVSLIGENFYGIQSNFKKFKSFEALKNQFNLPKLKPKSAILIKGSRGMALERVLELL